MSHLLFVYGTLKRGCRNHHHLQSEACIGPAQTTGGFELRDMGGYPGLVASDNPDAVVTGEVWTAAPATLRALDEFEGVDHGLYRRGQVPLAGDFAHQAIDAYFPVQSVHGPSLGGTWHEA